MGEILAKKRLLLAGTACAVLLLAFAPAKAHAEDTASVTMQTPPSRATLTPDSLLDLAEKFVARVGTKLKTADALLANEIDLEDMRMQPYFEGLEDGEPLILQISLREEGKSKGSRIKIDQPVLGIKQKNDVLLSLTDFSSVAAFPIKVDSDNGQAHGWFIRESQNFDLDIPAGTLNINGKDIPFDANDVTVDNGDILIRGKALSTWLNFNLVVNPRAQSMDIKVAQKWPILEKIDRYKRAQKKVKKNQPEQPFTETAYETASVPRVDVFLQQRLNKRASTGTNTDTSHTITAQGDLFGHTAQLRLTGGDQEPLNTAYLNFSKASEKNDLLGPLQAGFYEFNDVNTTRVPLSGTSPVEQGFHITNKNPRITQDTTTVIDGDSIPGWDVELFRGQQYIAGQTIGDDGRYLFENITLFAGDNNFRVIQYGPQGEIRENTQTISVAPSQAGSDKGLYDVSLTLQNTRTYTSNPSNDEDRNTPHLAFTYDKKISDQLTWRTGLNARDQNGEMTAYAYNGIATVHDNTLYNLDSVLAENGTFSLAGTARKRIGKHNLSSRVQYDSEDFATARSKLQTNVPALMATSTSLSGPFMPLKLKNATYDANVYATYRQDRPLRAGGRFAVANKLGPLQADNSIAYQTNGAGSRLTGLKDKIEGSSGLRGRFLSTNWRARSTYQIAPEMFVKKVEAFARKKLSDRVDGEIGATHEPEKDYSLFTASASYQADYANIAPSLNYDSNDDLTAKINVRFGIAHDPNSGENVISYKSLSNKGGVSAFVFLDKEGDGIYNNEDEPLQDVIVEATQAKRESFTDEKGEAFIYDLSDSRITDIVVQESSTFEPNWVSGFSGISVRPRPGGITKVEFPIQRGAEIDGTAYIEDHFGVRTEARGMRLKLIALSGRVEAIADTPFDGFYLFSRIRPGIYYLISDTTQSPMTATMTPKKIIITPEGGAFYGQNLTLYKGYDIPVTLSSTNEEPVGPKRARVIQPDDVASQEVLIKFGEYTSRLSMMLDWYKFKIKGRSSFSSLLVPVVPPGDVAPDPKTGLLTLTMKSRYGLSVSQGMKLCQRLSKNGFKCGMEIKTTYRPLAAPTEEDVENGDQLTEKEANIKKT